MTESDALTAIFVPSELEHEVSEWLQRKYRVSVVQNGAQNNVPEEKERGTRQTKRSGQTQRRPKSATGNDVWARLSTPRCTLTRSPRAETSNVDTAEAAKKKQEPHASHSGMQVYERLYAEGISQRERQRQASDAARRKREAEEESLMRRGKVLNVVLSRSENHKLSGDALEEKMIATALSSATRGHSTTGSKAGILHDKPSPDRFQQLYHDGEARDRKLDELRDRYRERERSVMTERKMRD